MLQLSFERVESRSGPAALTCESAAKDSPYLRDVSACVVITIVVSGQHTWAHSAKRIHCSNQAKECEKARIIWNLWTKSTFGSFLIVGVLSATVTPFPCTL